MRAPWNFPVAARRAILLTAIGIWAVALVATAAPLIGA